MSQSFTVNQEQHQQTLAALLRQWLPGQSWSHVRRLVDARRVQINGELWLDSARRLKVGDTVTVLEQSQRKIEHVDQIPIRFVDEHIVVVEKPAGISTVRHPAERDWLEERRLKVQTLDDLTARQIGMQLPRHKHEPRPRLRIVQRLDKETSGLVVFARTVIAERNLGFQFAHHTVLRRYLALVPGDVQPGSIRSHLVRDRGDGRRGSGPQAEGKEAITHMEVSERLSGYTLLSCRLETGRTHQIRIHLAEAGHPVCGDRVYRGPLHQGPILDSSGAPRLFLHAAELGFEHPVTTEKMHWDMPLPLELRATLERLRSVRV
jgi:23S rRNA pseudouridine1911/1915/1917 synthase